MKEMTHRIRKSGRKPKGRRTHRRVRKIMHRRKRSSGGSPKSFRDSRKSHDSKSAALLDPFGSGFDDGVNTIPLTESNIFKHNTHDRITDTTQPPVFIEKQRNGKKLIDRGDGIGLFGFDRTGTSPQTIGGRAKRTCNTKNARKHRPRKNRKRTRRTMRKWGGEEGNIDDVDFENNTVELFDKPFEEHNEYPRYSADNESFIGSNDITPRTSLSSGTNTRESIKADHIESTYIPTPKSIYERVTSSLNNTKNTIKNSPNSIRRTAKNFLDQKIIQE